MMLNVFGRLRIVAIGLGVIAAGSVVEASVLSLKAVKKNGVALPTPTSNLAVLGGDTIEAEIFLNSWGNDFPLPTTGVRFYQAQINATGFISPDNGALVPLGWCRPLAIIPCPPTCPLSYPTCDPNTQIGCRCTTGNNPTLGGFITTTRSDFLFFGLDPLRDVDTVTLGFTYFALAPDSAVPYAGVSKYLGTLIVTVSANACGTFTINFDPDRTFIGDAANPANTSLPTFQPLNLTVSNCARQLMSCSPAHCNVDARIAIDPKTGAKLNPNTIDMTYSKPTTGMTSADFQVSVEPFVGGDTIPTIFSVTPDAVNPNKVRLVFIPRIAQTRWTCFRDIGSNKRCCMGSLPGDADNNQISNTNDIFKEFDNLAGGVNPILAIEKCDTDRSLQCSPADLLMIVDLLNGADMFDPTMNQVLPALDPACPDMRLRP